MPHEYAKLQDEAEDRAEQIARALLCQFDPCDCCSAPMTLESMNICSDCVLFVCDACLQKHKCPSERAA